MKFFMLLYENCHAARIPSLPTSSLRHRVFILTFFFFRLPWTVALALCGCIVPQKSIYFILSENAVMKES